MYTPPPQTEQTAQTAQETSQKTMISGLEQPRPHKSLTLCDALAAPKHASSISNNTRANLRSRSLPTPAPSPCPSQSSASASASSSSAFSSPLVDMLALGNPAGSIVPFTRSFSPFGPMLNPSQPRVRALRQCMPVTPDASCLALPILESEQIESFRASKSRVVRLSDFPASPDVLTRALASLFPLFFSLPSVSGIADGGNQPTPVRMWTLRESVVEQDGERPVWAVFTSHEEACATLGLSGTCDSGLRRSSINVMPALESELEPFSKLQPFNLDLPLALASNPISSTQPVAMGLQTLMRYPPSPTSTNVTDAETEAELFFPDARDDLNFAHGLTYDFGHGQTLGIGCGSQNTRAMTPVIWERSIPTIEVQTMRACGFTLSTNPPKARTGFRHGDWICAVPACAAHNFGRNVTCIQCAAPRPSNLALIGSGSYAQLPPCSNGLPNAQVTSYTYLGARNTSPRFANATNMQSLVLTQHQPQQQQELLMKAQVQAQPQAQTHPLLTPSGRAFAVGGKTQNISPDPLAPCVMFWPDNEPLPEPGQIRPASLVNIPQPPIMNTGNKGPIERQPGDWICRKCDYLNWRRRKVCQTCFPYAEGNGDSVSATMHAERLALLAAVYGQTHPQITYARAQASQQFPGRAQNHNGSFQVPMPTASTQYSSAASNTPPLSSLSGYPLAPPSSHRSQFSSAPSPPLRPAIPSNASVTNSRDVGRMSQSGATQRMQVTTPESSLGSGSIVYQTPPSPAVVRPPPSISSALALSSGHVSLPTPSPTRTGPLLPSFLKREVQPFRPASRPFSSMISTTGSGTRSPASLSPTSSTSADLPFDEHDGPAKPVGIIGSGRSVDFYAHPRGAGSGSSMGSSSSLTLAGGGSIWSLERDEDKRWNNNNGVFTAVEALKGLTL